MMTTLELESTLTNRYQTTIPNAVRRALKLGKRDKIRYSVQPDGAVLLTRATQGEVDDPILAHFLQFLAHDIEVHPDHVHQIDANWLQRVQSLVHGVEVDLNTQLPIEHG